MKVAAKFNRYAQFRQDPQWVLLASDDAPRTMALLKTVFEDDAAIPYSMLLGRLNQALEELRDSGESIAQSASYFVNAWRNKGWLSRTLHAHMTEEEYSPTLAASSAIKYLESCLSPKKLTTESRMNSVTLQVIQLVSETETDSATRIERLVEKRAQIDAQIADIVAGKATPMVEDRARERMVEIVSQAQDLVDGFKSLGAFFSHLNQELREKLIKTVGSRGKTLEVLFDGLEYIKNSDEGRSFMAFWTLLNDLEQREQLQNAIDTLVQRNFAKDMPQEAEFLADLTYILYRKASDVQRYMHVLGDSLNRFVKSGEVFHASRLSEVLSLAKVNALSARAYAEDVDFTDCAVLYEVGLSCASVDQYVLKDPICGDAPKNEISMMPAKAVPLDEILTRIKSSDIDTAWLRQTIDEALKTCASITIGQLLERYPAKQGLGTIAGYIKLGLERGQVNKAAHEEVSWVGRDGVTRHVRICVTTFSRQF